MNPISIGESRVKLAYKSGSTTKAKLACREQRLTKRAERHQLAKATKPPPKERASMGKDERQALDSHKFCPYLRPFQLYGMPKHTTPSPASNGADDRDGVSTFRGRGKGHLLPLQNA
ncbi:uncharacterized protein A4U43_C05F11410 [Asparagus officinalis]|uniref:Uncharacterized protein n=1 Tax=Asparagus officinalis TaxID=4686 RepID=A0A5P1EUN2_ASPOF|nr:uncharacterized protein A4U43_C05F11410 [Asparagus officinalis]